MIRFVDLTAAYWTDPESGGPICAFLDTITDRFIENSMGIHTCSDMEDVLSLGMTKSGDLGERCAGLLPPGFFDKQESTSKPVLMNELEKNAHKTHVCGHEKVALRWALSQQEPKPNTGTHVAGAPGNWCKLHKFVTTDRVRLAEIIAELMWNRGIPASTNYHALNPNDTWVVALVGYDGVSLRPCFEANMASVGCVDFSMSQARRFALELLTNPSTMFDDILRATLAEQ